MSTIIAFIQAHSTIAALVSYYTASAAIGSLPAPTATSHPFYRWFYQFANTLAGNLSRAFSTRVEKSPNFQDAIAIQSSSNKPITP